MRLGRKFDLIVMTGNAFQVFLTEVDQRGVLDTIAGHLAPAGRFIFDMRNPAEAEWRTWTPQKSKRNLTHPDLGRIEAWNDVAEGPGRGIVTYQTFYREAASGRLHQASSQIRFTSRAKLETLMTEAGLKVDRWMGDWQGAPIGIDTPAIIPIGRLAG